MRKFVFRNYTVEYLFEKGTEFSGYNNSISYSHNVDLFIWFYQYPLKENDSNILSEIENYTLQLDLFMNNNTSEIEVLLFTLCPICRINWTNSSTEVIDAIKRYNEHLNFLSSKNKNVYVVDFSDFLCKYPEEKLIDWKYYYYSQMIINPTLINDFKCWFTKKMEAIRFKRKKCLVLDLDNTLWGGILGEDGASGIKLGNSYPGNIYSAFQRNLLEAKNHGLILAVCSKNNENDVLNVWENNSEIILKKEHFSAYRINWNNKAQNIQEIADELNIGIDSIVFIDDNPVERELVKSILPQVIVPEFPDKIYDLNKFFNNVYNDYFQVYQLTNEDIVKTNQYKDNSERKKAKEQSLSIEAYINSLETELFVEKANEFTISRVSQMTQKTNQFNLTTYRYSESDILKFIEQGSLVLTLRVKDKFGDNGISGLAIVHFKDNVADLDTFLLSCRVLGRNIEQDFLSEILRILKDETNVTVFEGKYVKTLKNGQVSDFFDNIGFQLTRDAVDFKTYSLDINL